MAYDQRTTLSNEKKVDYLAASNSKASTRLVDQFVHKLGTSRKSEIIAKVGDNGKSWKEFTLDYLRGL
jgi:hypothetical protein